MYRLMRLRGRTLGAVLLAAAMLVVLGAAGAQASDRGRAERLYTRGLAELHAGRTEEAIALFKQSVEANPKDMHALYYRALGYGRAGRYDEAVDDLQVVVASGDPSIERDRLELGYALYRLERYDESAVQLEIASKKERSGPEATMLLGIVESRRGNHEAAEAALARVQNMDSQKTVPARYYRGLAAYRAGQNEDATTEFVWVRNNGAGSPFAREADAFLSRMSEGGTGRRYSLHAGTALEYDSNVTLAPDGSNVLGVSGESDGRAVITAGGRYAAVAGPKLNIAVGYNFLQSLHFDLEEFDVQTHRAGADATYLQGPMTFGFATYYEHSLLDEDSLLNGAVMMPWFRYDEGDFGRSEVYYRARRRAFLQNDYDVRDAWNHAVGARQFFSLGARGRNIIVGYRYDAEEVDDPVEEYGYDGHQFEGGLEWALPWELRAAALYAYKMEEYGSFTHRDDDEHTVIASLEKQVWDYLWVTGSYIYRRNKSDEDLFDYSRHIASLGVEARY